MSPNSILSILYFVLAVAHLTLAGDNVVTDSDQSYLTSQALNEARQKLNLHFHNQLPEPSIHLYPIAAPHPAPSALREQVRVQAAQLAAARNPPILSLHPSSSSSGRVGGKEHYRVAEEGSRRKMQRVEGSRHPRGKPAVYPAPPVRVEPQTRGQSPLADIFKAHPNVGSFYQNGLRYGTIPPSHVPLGTGPGSARGLLPEDIRWTFGQVEARQNAYRIAFGEANLDLKQRQLQARETLRLYEQEADQIRRVIGSRGELPLYTSEEWKQWVREYGPALLMAPSQQDWMREAIGVEAFNAQNNIAQLLREGEDGVGGEGGEVIKLNGVHEKAAAKSLVSLWTAAHDRILRGALESVRP